MQTKNRVKIGLSLTWSALSSLVAPALAQSPSECAIQLSATVQSDPPQITLFWPAMQDALGYSVFRRQRDETGWGEATQLAGDATAYPDTNVVTGRTYEYQLLRTANKCNAHSYVYAGIEAPLVDSRGKVVLVVE